MPMPNRNLTGSEQYRYAFQGQEKDPETGKEAFQLRLWDGRIGRWLTTDPYGQYSSPYLGMGNNPISGVDPDGGYKTWFGAALGWIGGGFQGKIDNPGLGGNKNYAISTITSGGDDFAFTVSRNWGGSDNYSSTSINNFSSLASFNSLNMNSIVNCHHCALMTNGEEFLIDGIGLYGTGGGSENFGRKRKPGEKIIDTYDMSEWLIPGAGGGRLRFMKHLPNTRNHIIRGVQIGIGAVDQVNNLNSILSPQLNSNLDTSIMRTTYIIHLGSHVSSQKSTFNFSGNRDGVLKSVDSLDNILKNRKSTSDNWFNN